MIKLLVSLLLLFPTLLQAQSLTAVLSVKSGKAVKTQDVKKIFKDSRVVSHRDLFTTAEKDILKSIQAQRWSQTWVLTLRSEKDFQSLKKSLEKSLFYLDRNALDLKTSSADPFEAWQWGFKNTGAAQIIDLDPAMTFRVPGVVGEDIHMTSNFISVVPTPKIKVAVLDTGISHLHPDLYTIIQQKPGECAALEQFKQCLTETDRTTCEKKWMDMSNPEVDTDKNGYPLDCSGWSTLGGINQAKIMGKPDFDDDHGHGTHVAGIIAAIAGNGIGVRGVSQNVEIIPIQVIGNGPAEPIKPLSVEVDLNPSEEIRQGKAPNGLSDLVARGMIYAIRSGAQVISFSLGWPQATDSEFMRSLVEEAQRRGIIIVAAAGNDSTRALLRPCAYPGVICVGAAGADGALAHFSNFGSGVDVAAPGVNILSTYPMELSPVRFRWTLGYEYLSGTSQATPFVTGLVAEMLARGIPTKDIYPRLILGARALQKNQSLIEGGSHLPGVILPAEQKPYEKYILSGFVDFEQSLQIRPQALIVPASKEKPVINWDRKSKNLIWKMSLQNRWKDVNVADVELRSGFKKKTADSIRPQVTSIKPLQAMTGVWGQGEVRDYEIEFQIVDAENPLNSRIPSDLELALQVTVKGQNQFQYTLEADVLVPISADMQDPEAQIFPLTNLPKTRYDFVPVDENLDGDLQKRDYFLISQVGTTSKYQAWLLSQNKQSVYETIAGPTFTVSGDAMKLRTQIQVRMDLDGQGKTQYVLGFFEDLSQEDEPKNSPMSFFFFDSSMKLVDSFKFDAKLAQIPFNFAWQQVGARKMPAWVGYGRDPKKVPSLMDLWENPTDDEKLQLRFYYLDENKKLKAIAKFQEYLIVDTLQPTPKQMREGRVPVLLAKNKGTPSKPSYIYDFATAEIIQGQVQNFKVLNLFGGAQTAGSESYRNILDTRVDKVNSLDPQGGEYNGSFWFSEGQLRSQRVSYLNTENQFFLDKNLKALKSQFDSALWVRAVYDGSQRKGAFVLTNSEVQYHNLVTGKVVSTSFERYTFFPDFFMSNAYFPLTLKDTQNVKSKLPALFTTEESELSRGVKVLVPVFASGDEVVEVVSPARLRFVSGKGCRPLNTPVFSGAEGSSFDYYCGDKIIRMPLQF